MAKRSVVNSSLRSSGIRTCCSSDAIAWALMKGASLPPFEARTKARYSALLKVRVTRLVRPLFSRRYFFRYSFLFYPWQRRENKKMITTLSKHHRKWHKSYFSMIAKFCSFGGKIHPTHEQNTQIDCKNIFRGWGDIFWKSPSRYPKDVLWQDGIFARIFRLSLTLAQTKNTRTHTFWMWRLCEQSRQEKRCSQRTCNLAREVPTKVKYET